MAIKHFWYKLYAKQGLLYKFFLAVVLVVAIVFLLPKGSKFSYEFQAGKPWLYPALYAPFDFTLKKTSEQLAKEKQYIESQSPTYFFRDTTVLASVQKNYYQKALTYFASVETATQEKLLHKGEMRCLPLPLTDSFFSTKPRRQYFLILQRSPLLPIWILTIRSSRR